MVVAGYQDVNDSERLRYDPAMRWTSVKKRVRVVLHRAKSLNSKPTFKLAAAHHLGNFGSNAPSVGIRNSIIHTEL